MSIRAEFATTQLNERGTTKSDAVREDFSNFLDALGRLAGSEAGAREMAIVRTKLQEAAMFAQRAVAADPSNQAHPTRVGGS